MAIEHHPNGDRWLAADSEKLVTDMDGRYGLPRDLKPGEWRELAPERLQELFVK